MDVFLIVVGGFIVFFVLAVIWGILSLIFKEWKLTLFFFLLLCIPIGLFVSFFNRSQSNVLVAIGFVGCAIWLFFRMKRNF